MSSFSRTRQRFSVSTSRMMFLVAIAVLLAPTVLLAHPGHGRVHGFEDGFIHPFSGVDHCVAMIAIGVWAAQAGGRTCWLAPLTTVLFMALGGSLGMNVKTVPFVEHAIVTSILVLGLLITVTRKLPIIAVLSIIAVFAAIHGFAHGIELPRSVNTVAYGQGILLGSVLVQLASICTTTFIIKLGQTRLVQLSGALLAVSGIVMFFQQ